MGTRTNSQRAIQLHTKFVHNIGDYPTCDIRFITTLIEQGVTDASLESEWHMWYEIYNSQFTPEQQAQKLHDSMVKDFGERQNTTAETVLSWMNEGLSEEQVMRRYLRPVVQPTMEEATRMLESLRTEWGECPEVTVQNILEKLQKGVPRNLLVAYYTFIQRYVAMIERAEILREKMVEELGSDFEITNEEFIEHFKLNVSDTAILELYRTRQE